MSHTYSPALFCISGTDTDAGKSLVTAALLRAFSCLGIPAQGIKIVQTGCAPGPDGYIAPDVSLYREAAPGSPSRALACFKTPCSPHLAAKLEGKNLSATALRDELMRHTGDFAGITLAEGAGGLFVPLNERECLIDLLALLQAPVILAAPNRLGAINHVLLSLEALRLRSLHLAGLIFAENMPPEIGDELGKAIRQDNIETIGAFGETAPIPLPYMADLHSADTRLKDAAWDKAAKHLTPLASRIAASGVRYGG